MTGSYCVFLIMSASYGLTDMQVHELFCTTDFVINDKVEMPD